MKTRCDEWIQREYQLRKEKISSELGAFKKSGNQANRDELFSGLCYCICTPQNRFENVQTAIEELEKKSILFLHDQDVIAYILKKNGVRFHNRKAEYIMKARVITYDIGCPQDIKNLVVKLIAKEQKDARKYICSDMHEQGLLGLGMKEASHFLRNIGHGEDIAILDSHILDKLLECGVIEYKPKNPTYEEYLNIEAKMREWATQLGIKLGELDLLLWSEETGYIFE